MHKVQHKLQATAHIGKLVYQLGTRTTKPITTITSTLQKTYSKLKTNG